MGKLSWPGVLCGLAESIAVASSSMVMGEGGRKGSAIPGVTGVLPVSADVSAWSVACAIWETHSFVCGCLGQQVELVAMVLPGNTRTTSK